MAVTAEVVAAEEEDKAAVAAVSAADVAAVDAVLVVHEKCTKLSALNARKNAKCLSNLQATDRYIAENVSKKNKQLFFL